MKSLRTDYNVLFTVSAHCINMIFIIYHKKVHFVVLCWDTFSFQNTFIMPLN